MHGLLTLDTLKDQVSAGDVDTVLACIVDMQGRLMGKRFHAVHFIKGAWEETHCCNYLLATDLEMATPDGYAASGWQQGYGDYIMKPDGPISFWFRYLVSSLKARGLIKHAAPDGHPDPDSITWQEVAEFQVAWGSPSTVVDKLVALRDITGHFGVLTAMAHEWDDHAFCKKSLALLTEEVMPAFSQHAEAGRAAAAE